MSSNLPKNKLLEYLRTIIQLESLKQTHLKAKNIVRDKTNACNAIIEKRDTAYTTVGKTTKPESLSGYTLISGIMLGIVCSFFIVAICYVLSVIRYIITAGDLLGWLFSGWDWGWLIDGPIIGGGIGFVISVIVFIKSIVKYNNAKKANKANVIQYNKDVDIKNKKLADTKKYAKNLKAICLKEADIISIDERKINKLIDDMYACNIIHPKYQKIEFICKAYEYLDTGICSVLEGPNGVYARLEDDIKYERVMKKLDVIIYKLDEIINNQRDSAFMLSQLVGGVNKLSGSLDSVSKKFDTLSDNITASNASIESSLKSIEYNSAVTSQCVKFSAICDYYKLKKYS